MIFSDHHDFDLSENLLFEIDFSAAAYIILYNTFAAEFKSFTQKQFECK